jgi:hypothetical protein
LETLEDSSALNQEGGNRNQRRGDRRDALNGDQELEAIDSPNGSRDLAAWLDYDYTSVFLAALWSDDEASIAVRFALPEPISAAEFDPQAVIDAALSSKYGGYTEARLAA